MIALLFSTCFVASLSVQDDTPKSAPAAKWTQAELEAVSAKIQGQIETLRGMKYTRPVAVKITDKQGLLEYMREREAKTDSPERLARDEMSAKLLGMIAPDLDLHAVGEKFLEQQVGGFYDPGSNTFYLMETFTGGLAKIILAHELTHALDDQQFDLDKTLAAAKQETDAELALRALFEGSGTAAMYEWMFAHPKEIDRASLANSEGMEMQGLEDTPPFVWKPLLASYLRGGGFLVHIEGLNLLNKAVKNAELQTAFKDPPRSTEQILHPDKYWDPKQRDEPRRLEFDITHLPEGWTVAGLDTLGELTLCVLTTPFEERGGLDAKNALALLGVHYSNKASEGWGGDRLVLLAKGEARALYFASVWDTAQDAREFREALVKLRESKAPAAEAWRKSLSGFELSTAASETDDTVWLRAEWKNDAAKNPLPRILPWEEVRPATPSAGASSH